MGATARLTHEMIFHPYRRVRVTAVPHLTSSSGNRFGDSSTRNTEPLHAEPGQPELIEMRMEVWRRDGTSIGVEPCAGALTSATGSSFSGMRKSIAPMDEWGGPRGRYHPTLIVCDEFPAGYSSTGCSAAEPISASPATPMMAQPDGGRNQMAAAARQPQPP